MVVGDKKKHLAVILTLKSLVDDNNQVSADDYTFEITNLLSIDQVKSWTVVPETWRDYTLHDVVMINNVLRCLCKIQELENVLHRGQSGKVSFYCKNF